MRTLNTCWTLCALIFLIAVPILTMRSIAEEKRQKTDSTALCAADRHPPKSVMGKYLSMLAVFAISVGIIGIYPLILTAYGTVNLLIAYSSLLGFLFMGACLDCYRLFHLFPYGKPGDRRGAYLWGAAAGLLYCKACFLYAADCRGLPSWALRSSLWRYAFSRCS